MNTVLHTQVNRTVNIGMREFHQTEPEWDHQKMDQRFHLTLREVSDT